AILSLLSLCTSAVIFKIKDPVTISKKDVDFYSRASYEIISRTKLPDDRERTLRTNRFAAIEEDKLNSLQHLWTVDHTTIPEGLILVLGFAVFGFGVSFFVGVNQFSLHGLYRNRLVRAYLGAS